LKIEEGLAICLTLLGTIVLSLQVSQVLRGPGVLFDLLNAKTKIVAEAVELIFDPAVLWSTRSENLPPLFMHELI
jgi:hypothetical protein